MQAYSDPKRAESATALPDIEVFWIDENDDETRDFADDGECLPAGWYWWSCFPGCLPDGEPIGPFDTEGEALADAQDTGD